MFFFQTRFAEAAAVAHENFDLLERLWSDWSPDWSLPPDEMSKIRQTFASPGVIDAALAYYRCALGTGAVVSLV